MGCSSEATTALWGPKKRELSGGERTNGKKRRRWKREPTGEQCMRSESHEVEESNAPVHTHRGDVRMERVEDGIPQLRSAAGRSTRTRPMPAPAEEELEGFFAKAEEEQRRRFLDKYNFDVVKDAPVEGRYEWVRLHP